MNRDYVLNELYYYINRSAMNSLDDEIALYLLKHSNEIPSKSLRAIAQQGFISQSTLSKYLKKVGLSYHDLQIGTAINQKTISQILMAQKSTMPYCQSEAIRDEIITRMNANVSMLKSVDLEHVEKIVKELLHAENVYFAGSDFSMGIINVIQSALNSCGVRCFTMFDPRGQKYMADHSSANDIYVYISIRGRAYSAHKEVSEAMFSSPCKTMLWTLDHNHIDKEKFNDVLYFGDNINEFGYTQLMCFTPLLLHILNRESN